MGITYANGQILAQHAGDYEDSRYFYLHDRLGSVRQIINTSGNVLSLYTYNPFGEVIETDGTLGNSFMFTGQYYDSEIDQYYLRARQYDPTIGRFTACDSIFGNFEDPLSLHKYLYCQNDSINAIDPWGLWTFHVMFTGTLSGIASGTYSIGWVIDDQGNLELIRSFGIGGGAPSAGMGFAFGATSADDVYQLPGLGYSVGGSISKGLFSVGADFIYAYEGQYWGAQITTEISLPSLPAEAHVHMTGTTVGDFSFSKFFEWFEKDILDRQIYGVKTLGQAETLLFIWGAASMINDRFVY